MLKAAKQIVLSDDETGDWIEEKKLLDSPIELEEGETGYFIVGQPLGFPSHRKKQKKQSALLLMVFRCDGYEKQLVHHRLVTSDDEFALPATLQVVCGQLGTPDKVYFGDLKLCNIAETNGFFPPETRCISGRYIPDELREELWWAFVSTFENHFSTQ